jgi:integrase
VKASIARGAERSAVITFDAASARYWLEKGQHSKERDLTEAIQRLVDWIGPATPLSDIDDNLLAQIVARRRGEPRMGRPKLGLVSAATVNRTVTELLRRILTRARTVWKIPLPDEPNWSAHIVREPEERIRELGFDEEAKIEAEERDDYQPARLFAQATGLRRREIVTLTWPQVDWQNGVIRVVGKGDKPHVLPITRELTDILWPLRDHHPTHVFTFIAQRTWRDPKSGRQYVGGRRYPITEQGWSSTFRRMRKRAGIADLRLHDLRHTAGTRTLRASKNIRAVQKMLGHADIKTTMRYAHALTEDVAEAMRARPADEAERRAEHERRTNPRDNPEPPAATLDKARNSNAKQQS